MLEGRAAAVDLGHRALVARSRAGAEEDELAERAVALVGEVLAGVVLEAVAAGFGVPRSRRRAADEVRQALTADPGLGLGELGRVAGLSTYHLSRVFRETTGMTISRFRLRLRVRQALDRLAAGEWDLAALAAGARFADQAHLTRAVRRETGSTPGQLRALLTPDPAPESGQRRPVAYSSR